MFCKSFFVLLFFYFWPLYCLYLFDLRLLITLLVSFGHCIVCTSVIYGFWLPFWYLLAIVLSVLLWFTDSDCPFGIFWPLYCLYFFDLQILTLLVSFGHCIVCTSLILRILTLLVSFGHCIVCTSLTYGFWLPFWYLLAIVLSVLLWFTDSDCPFGIFWPLYCLYFFDLRMLTLLVSSNFSNELFTLEYSKRLFISLVLFTGNTIHICGIFNNVFSLAMGIQNSRDLYFAKLKSRNQQ